LVDTPLLKKIKAIQANELRNWKGLPVEYVSRPGNSDIDNFINRSHIECTGH